MRQATEDAVGPLGDGLGREVFQRQIEPAGERRMDLADGLRLGLARRERGDLHLRMAQQELDQLQGRVAGGTEDGDALFRIGHAF